MTGRKAGEGWAGPKASWSALLQRHNEAPLHIILGAGGHINGDVVFKVPSHLWSHPRQINKWFTRHRRNAISATCNKDCEGTDPQCW